MHNLGLVELTPRQLAPSVGSQKSVGIMVAPAPSAMKIDVRVARESIRFGSFEYVLHPPAHRWVYADLDKGIRITFGSVCCFADSRGMLRSATTASCAAAPASANLPPPSSRPAKIASVAPAKIASTAPAKIASAAPVEIALVAPGKIASATLPRQPQQRPRGSSLLHQSQSHGRSNQDLPQLLHPRARPRVCG